MNTQPKTHPILFTLCIIGATAAVAACSSDNAQERAEIDLSDYGIEEIEEPKTANIIIHPTIGSMCGIVAPDAYFSVDSAKLKGPSRNMAKSLADCAKSGALAGQTIKLVGRADPRGPADYNMRLGLERAQSVASLLISEGIDRDRIEVVSKGEKGFSKTRTGSAFLYSQQRRVDIQLADPKPVRLSIVYLDYDSDGRVENDEFYTYISGVYNFDGWDENGDGWLTEQELSQSIQKTWDANLDGDIDEEEFKRGSLTWYANGDVYGGFADWDTNNDGRIADDEWVASFNGQSIYNDFDQDRDNRMYEDEFSVRIHSHWDSNEDSSLDDTEISSYTNSLYWLSEG